MTINSIAIKITIFIEPKYSIHNVSEIGGNSEGVTNRRRSSSTRLFFTDFDGLFFFFLI